MADTDDLSSHTKSFKAHLEPVVFLKLRHRWADMNPPQYSPKKEQWRDGGAGSSFTNCPVRISRSWVELCS